jgi:hypothetical protein
LDGFFGTKQGGEKDTRFDTLNILYKMLHMASDLDGFFGTNQGAEKDTTFDTLNILSLYRSGSLT